MGFSSTTSATPIRRYAQQAATLQQPTPTPTPTPSKTMKLTVAALALLVAGASYADMAAAKDRCFHGSKAQEKCDNYVTKHWGTKCEAMGFGKSEVCAVPLSAPPAPPGPIPVSPTPAPPTPSVKVDDLPLYKATHNQFGLGSCQYKTKHGVNHSAKCTGVDKHENGMEVPVQYQAKNLDNPEKVQEQIHFHGKVKANASPGWPVQVNGGGKVKYDAKHNTVKGEGKEKLVRNPSSTGGSTKPTKETVTYDCSGNGSGITCKWSD